MISPTNPVDISADNEPLSAGKVYHDFVHRTKKQYRETVGLAENRNVFGTNLSPSIPSQELSHNYYPVTSLSPDYKHYSSSSSYSSDEYQPATSSSSEEKYHATSLSNVHHRSTSVSDDCHQINISSSSSLRKYKYPTTPSTFSPSARKTAIKQTKELSKTTERRNARERKRIGHLKTHFENLQTRLPDNWKSSKMSKLDILTKSIRYIRHLENILSGKSQHQDLWALCSPVLHVNNQQNGGTQTTRTVTYQLSNEDCKMTSLMTTTDCFRLNGNSKKSHELSDHKDMAEMSASLATIPNSFLPST